MSDAERERSELEIFIPQELIDDIDCDLFDYVARRAQSQAFAAGEYPVEIEPDMCRVFAGVGGAWVVIEDNASVEEADDENRES